MSEPSPAYDEKHGPVDDVEKNPQTDVADAIRSGSVIDKKILEHATDADEAMKAFMEADGQVLELDEETNKRILRKIDWNLMPLMCVVYMLNFLDKTSISYASVMHMKQDIHLEGNDYQWLGSVFYFGYLAWEYPTNRLLQRLPLGKYSAFNVILWGACLSCFAAVENFQGAVAVRFFLGLFESAVTPGFSLLTSQWYTVKEQGFRTGIWFSFNGWAQIVGGLVAYGIARGTDINGSSIESWKIVFITIGLLTVVVGFWCLYAMPDNQLNARFLTKEERLLAVERVRVNQQGIGNKHFKMYQVKEALSDPLTWAFVAYSLIADIPNGGLTNFFSQLIESFGYTSEQSLLYGTPSGAVEIISLLSAGYLGDKLGSRIIVSTFWMWMSLIGIILIVALPLENNGGRLAGYYLTGASATSFVALLSLISSNVAGYTKKTTVAALFLVSYCVGNIIGPQTFRPSDAPRYVPAEIVIIVCYAVCIADMYFIYWYCRLQNKRKQAIRDAPDYVRLENQEFLDLTDRENPDFVYTL
ncbi:hypothetical protein AAFC00_001667 [Neodothiora populina]|uniref:Major facilitator superfamily (MFS) profile domain-containing protein n=1 Tax=Neodothiora populina TaxID=2781224 RepID=A0ABR3PPR8_9PEZI